MGWGDLDFTKCLGPFWLEIAVDKLTQYPPSSVNLHASVCGMARYAVALLVVHAAACGMRRYAPCMVLSMRHGSVHAPVVGCNWARA